MIEVPKELVKTRIERYRIRIEDARHVEDMGLVALTIGVGIVALNFLLGVAIGAVGFSTFFVFGRKKRIEENLLIGLLIKEERDQQPNDAQVRRADP